MEATPLQSPPETLLIIDDEPLMTDLFRQFMTKRGFRVLTASSGPEALSILDIEADALRLVITDMALPGMDGLEIAQAFAQRAPHTPVLIATGHDQAATREGLPQNVVGVVQKPYQNRVLAERIREILDIARQSNSTPRPIS